MTETQTEIRLAIIDENRILRQAWQLYLNQCPGFSVLVSAGSIDAAVKTPGLDFVSLSLIHPGPYPDSFLTELVNQRVWFQHQKILVCQNGDEYPGLIRALSAGAINFFNRLRPLDDLPKAILQTIHGQSMITPFIATYIIKHFGAARVRLLFSDTGQIILNRIAAGDPVPAIGNGLGLTEPEISHRVQEIYQAIRLYQSGV